MEGNAELQGIFGTLRLVQALFLSAPLALLRAVDDDADRVPKGDRRPPHRARLDAAISYVAVVLALTAFVTSPATDRPCRVRGWLIHSKLMPLGCSSTSPPTSRFVRTAVAVVGYAAGAWTFILPPVLLLALWAMRPLIDEAHMLFSSLGLGGSFSPGLPLFAYHEARVMPAQTTSSRGVVASLFAVVFCCCRSHACCVRPVRVWLDTALRNFAFLMAPPVLDGLGSEPKRLFLEFLARALRSEAAERRSRRWGWRCAMMPHPHSVRKLAASSTGALSRWHSRPFSRPPPSSGASCPR